MYSLERNARSVLFGVCVAEAAMGHSIVHEPSPPFATPQPEARGRVASRIAHSPRVGLAPRTVFATHRDGFGRSVLFSIRELSTIADPGGIGTAGVSFTTPRLILGALGPRRAGTGTRTRP
jgi:hypothetical protein